MKTDFEKVTATVQIWAIPQSKWALENQPDLPLFYYDLRVGKCYTDGAVHVADHEVTLEVPEGIDLTARAVDTLIAEQQRTRAEAEVRVVELQEQINGLLLIEHKPDLQVVDVLDVRD